jgi:hypothetical protein
MLKTVAIGTMVNASAIEGLNAVKFRHDVLQTGREQNFAGHQGRAVGALYRELAPYWADLGHTAGTKGDGLVLLKLAPCCSI